MQKSDIMFEMQNVSSQCCFCIALLACAKHTHCPFFEYCSNFERQVWPKIVVMGEYYANKNTN